MLKILHIVPSYKPAYIYGGPIESVSKLCEAQASVGHTVKVFTTTANGEAELEVKAGKELDVDGVCVTYFKRITKDHTHISFDLWKQLAKEGNKYDLIHIHSWWNILVIVATIICHAKKSKVVISPRGMLSGYIFTSSKSFIKKVIHSSVGKKVLKKSAFHATSQAEYDECKDLIPGWKGFMVPNILTLPPLPLVKKANEVFTLQFLSRIHPKKGLEFLFETIANIPFPVVLKIAGSGEEEYITELKQKAKELNIESKIQWLGWQDRASKFDLLMNADLFVLTSYNENFANVVIESLHVGTPVMVSDKVGLAAFIESEHMGWVSSLSTAAITKTIIAAINDVAARKRIAAEGPEIIKSHFSIEKLVDDYVIAYQKVLYQ
ncbi:glycosyltransferase [Ilyomonas limi]|uniref:Glycosyltransferase n=1 Tax=Ilyomonas limi TaxID=2575867 RepID=A0A4U3L3P8_9BACT|nr:glycosyltransferase [Ilyomonas limi]TKK68206.1 glycosyltransferase [Ilyomonas limi]